MHEVLSLRIIGVSPLIMHNGQLANPMNEFSRAIKKISGKRQKTDADFEEMARLEFLGSLYLSNQQPCIPGECLEATLVNAAKKRRRGDQAKAGILCDEMYPLEYEGPRAPGDLWSEPQFRLTVGARVQRNRVMRTRPIFRQWAAGVRIKFMPSLLNKSEVAEITKIAGEIVGLLDWRPRFGRYTIEN